jgi:hypothetical protein
MPRALLFIGKHIKQAKNNSSTTKVLRLNGRYAMPVHLAVPVAEIDVAPTDARYVPPLEVRYSVLASRLVNNIRALKLLILEQIYGQDVGFEIDRLAYKRPLDIAIRDEAASVYEVNLAGIKNILIKLVAAWRRDYPKAQIPIEVQYVIDHKFTPPSSLLC